MTDSKQRMIENHPRTGVAHHLTDTPFHVLAVTMHLAQPARRLVLAERTPRQPAAGIVNQSPATVAKALVALLMTAIQAHHYL